MQRLVSGPVPSRELQRCHRRAGRGVDEDLGVVTLGFDRRLFESLDRDPSGRRVGSGVTVSWNTSDCARSRLSTGSSTAQMAWPPGPNVRSIDAMRSELVSTGRRGHQCGYQEIVLPAANGVIWAVNEAEVLATIGDVGA